MEKTRKNRGSASLEASLVLPVFLLAMVYLYLVFQSVLAEAVVYEAAAETVEYLAEYSYIGTGDLLVAKLRFPHYVDDEQKLAQYIEGGVDGVSFLGSMTPDADDMIALRVRFRTKYAGEQDFTIRKRAYTGAKESTVDEAGEDRDVYVYVTENESVYHTTRTCSYLTLSIRQASLSHAEKLGYHPCGFCGESCGDAVWITEDGRSYHSDVHCSGLKRTVYRKKKSEVAHLQACSRCGRE